LSLGANFYQKALSASFSTQEIWFSEGQIELGGEPERMLDVIGSACRAEKANQK
jgi:hypothetical protein